VTLAFTKKIVTQFVLMVLLTTVANSQSRAVRRVNLSRPYWARNVRAGTFTRGAKIKIYGIRFEKNFAEVTLRHWPEYFEYNSEETIRLNNKSKVAFQRSFAFLFSSRKLEPFSGDCPYELKTRADVIRCLGPPKETKKEGSVVRYEYDTQFPGGSFGGWQTWWIELKHNRVIKIWGAIP